jgi:hypothetical protein
MEVDIPTLVSREMPFAELETGFGPLDLNQSRRFDAG